MPWQTTLYILDLLYEVRYIGKLFSLLLHDKIAFIFDMIQLFIISVTETIEIERNFVDKTN